MLPDIGFEVTEDYAFAIHGWFNLTDTAIRWSTRYDDEIQDNRKLPDILRGVDTLFGVDTPAAHLVRAVLFHMSITVIDEWEAYAPITDAEATRYISAALHPMQEALMIADSQAWNFWETAITSRENDAIRARFAQIAAVRDELESNL